MGQADSPGGQWPAGSADHAGIGSALQDFIQGCGTGGDERNAGEGFKQADMNAGNAGADRAEIEAGPGGNHDQRGDTGFEELDVVGDQAGGGGSADAGEWLGL